MSLMKEQRGNVKRRILIATSEKLFQRHSFGDDTVLHLCEEAI